MKKEKVEAILDPLLPSIWDLACRHRSARVRYTSLLLLRRVFDTAPSLIPLDTLKILVSGILNRLKDGESRVAAAACNVLASLTQALKSTVRF